MVSVIVPPLSKQNIEVFLESSAHCLAVPQDTE
jgi:hypothetical protein